MVNNQRWTEKYTRIPRYSMYMKRTIAIVPNTNQPVGLSNQSPMLVRVSFPVCRPSMVSIGPHPRVHAPATMTPVTNVCQNVWLKLATKPTRGCTARESGTYSPPDRG